MGAWAMASDADWSALSATDERQEFVRLLSKVPQVTVLFWILKVAATTLGETGGDALSMSLHLGYAVSTGIFLAFFLVVVAVQIRAKKFHRWLYWTVVVATTLAGTTIADFADRSLGIGYLGGSLILFGLVALSLIVWRLVEGTVSVESVRSPRVEMFYWITILLSNTLGTALGDWVADSGAGFEGGALLFGTALMLVVFAYLFTKIAPTVLFWTAFVLTRPLGATLGDLLTKPHASGGLELSRYTSTAVIGAFMVACLILSRREEASGRS